MTNGAEQRFRSPFVEGAGRLAAASPVDGAQSSAFLTDSSGPDREADPPGESFVAAADDYVSLSALQAAPGQLAIDVGELDDAYASEVEHPAAAAPPGESMSWPETSEFDAEFDLQVSPDDEVGDDRASDGEAALDEESELGEIEEFDDHADRLLETLDIDLGDVRGDVVQALEEHRFADAARRVLLRGKVDTERLTDMLVLAKYPELLYAPELESESQRDDRQSIGRLVSSAARALSAGFPGPGLVAGTAAAAGPQAIARRRKQSDPLRRFICTDADIAAINQALGLSVDEAALRDALLAAIGRARDLASRAADRLRRSSLRGAEGEATVSAFRNAFGVSPAFAPAWRPAGATWTRGSIVRVRLTRAQRQLGRGAHKILCWGPTRIVQGHWLATHRILPHKPSRSLFLGQGLWRDLLVARDPGSAAASLLGGTLTVNYKTIRKQHAHNHFGTAACYVRYVFDVNGLTPPSGAVERCAATGT